MIRTNIQATWKAEGWNVQIEAQMSMKQNKKNAICIILDTDEKCGKNAAKVIFKDLTFEN